MHTLEMKEERVYFSSPGGSYVSQSWKQLATSWRICNQEQGLSMLLRLSFSTYTLQDPSLWDGATYSGKVFSPSNAIKIIPRGVPSGMSPEAHFLEDLT